ncbi:hypothetical protein ACWGB8_22825 [Kitasatospora sp. NPDC054939]
MSESTATSTTGAALGQVLALVGTSPLTANAFLSWIRDGSGAPITAAGITGVDITAVVPADLLNALATAAGISAADAARGLAAELPALVAALPATTALAAVTTLAAFGAANPFSDIAQALHQPQGHAWPRPENFGFGAMIPGAAHPYLQAALDGAATSTRDQVNVLAAAGTSALAKADPKPGALLPLLRDL